MKRAQVVNCSSGHYNLGAVKLAGWLRDEGYRVRQPVIAEAVGVWECTFVGECSVVCPKGVDPAAAIQRSKVAGAKDWFMSLLLPKGE